MALSSYTFKEVTIDVSESTTVSTAACILGYQLVGVIVPVGWNADQQTPNLTLQVDPGDGTFYPVSGLTLTDPTDAEVTLLNTGAAAPYIVPTIVGVNLKVVSALAQSADRKVILLLVALSPGPGPA